MAKQIWLLAGGNGAGKSTFYNKFLKPEGIAFINADILQKELFDAVRPQDSYQASKLVAKLREKLLEEGKSFCFETVFSHESKIDFVARAKALGYEIIMVYIYLSSVELNMARISQRVAAGGHDVPEDKVISRIPRTIKHLKTVIPLADEVHILDNSRASNPFVIVATMQKRQWHVPDVKTIPDWLRALMPQ